MYRQINKRELQDLKVLDQTKVLDEFRKVTGSDIGDKNRRMITSRQMNRIREGSYGRWYLRPELFNKKVSKVNEQFTRLKQ